MSALSPAGLGQLFILKLEEDRWNRSLKATLRSPQVAGVIVSARSVKSPATLAHLLQKIRNALGTNLFLGLEADGPQPDPLRTAFPQVPLLPLPIEAGRKGVRAVETLGKLRGALLRLHGFNVDFAFSLNVTPPDFRTALAWATFASDPQQVAGCGHAYLRGLHPQKVLACAGHFPGLGSVEVDPVSRQPFSPKPMAGLWREDLVPFRELLPRIPLLMISHASYKAYDFDPLRPAVLSSNVVTGLLRVKLGYQGIAVADLPRLEAARGKLDAGDVAVRALEAGCDLIIVRGNRDSLEDVIQTVRNCLESGRLTTERLKKSLARIAAAKRGLAAPRGGASRRARQQLANQFKEWLKDFES